MKSLISVYHLFVVLNFLEEKSMEICELFYEPGMKNPKDFRYDVTQGTLVSPEDVFKSYKGMKVGEVVPCCSRKWVTEILTEVYK